MDWRLRLWLLDNFHSIEIRFFNDFVFIFLILREEFSLNVLLALHLLHDLILAKSKEIILDVLIRLRELLLLLLWHRRLKATKINLVKICLKQLLW